MALIAERLQQQSFGDETPRAEFAGNFGSDGACLERAGTLAQLLIEKVQPVISYHGGAPVSDLLGQMYRAPRVLKRGVKAQLHHRHHADHGKVCRFDAREAIVGAKLDAAYKHLPGSAEQAAHVIPIRQPAQRARLFLHRPRSLSQTQRLAVFGQAARDVTAREKGVAAQRMDARCSGKSSMASASLLSAVEQFNDIVESVQHRKTLGQPKKGAQMRGRRAALASFASGRPRSPPRSVPSLAAIHPTRLASAARTPPVSASPRPRWASDNAWSIR